MLTQYHLHILATAKKLFDHVIYVVSVDIDSYVKIRKGLSRPTRPYQDRVFTLTQLDAVDYLVPDHGHNASLIELVAPNYLVMSFSTARELPETRTADIELTVRLGIQIVVFSKVKGSITSTSKIIAR